jgi:GDSL-like Lipase/Acylhydrolase family
MKAPRRRYRQHWEWTLATGLAVGLVGTACGGSSNLAPSPDGQVDSAGRPGTGGLGVGAGSSGGGAKGTGGAAGAVITGGRSGGSGGSGAESGGHQGGGVGTGGSAGNSGTGGGVADAGTDTTRDASGALESGGPTYNPCPPAGTDCTIMPFGDSITDGFTVRGGYRIPFFQRAHQEGRQFTFVGSATNGPVTVDGVPFPQHHEGHSAYTINNEPSVPRNGIAPLVPTVIPRFHPDIVLLMIGTNDVDNSLDLTNLPNRLGTLIDAIIERDAHTLVVVAQITPTMQDPLNLRIQAYNAAIPAVVKSRAQAGKHVALVDMYGAFTQDPAYKTKYLADRLHPNAAGYMKMSDVWNTVVHDLLR